MNDKHQQRIPYSKLSDDGSLLIGEDDEWKLWEQDGTYSFMSAETGDVVYTSKDWEEIATKVINFVGLACRNDDEDPEAWEQEMRFVERMLRYNRLIKCAKVAGIVLLCIATAVLIAYLLEFLPHDLTTMQF